MEVLYNAQIHTMNPGQPTVSAVVIANNQIKTLGGEEMLTLFPNARRKDMEGRFILPGFVDSHIHLQQYALQKRKIDCETNQKESIINLVFEMAKKTPPGTWILGHGWNQNDWGGEWPSAAELDKAAPNHPVYLTAKSLHAGWVNSQAMRLAGITQNSPDPKGGVILRFSNGHPKGILLEKAMDMVNLVIPVPAPEELAKIFKDVIPELWKLGLTSIHNFDKENSFRALQILHQNNELDIRVLQALSYETMEEDLARGLHTGMGNDTLRIGPLKLFSDGALGPHTGAMIDPYVNEPENYGLLQLTGEDIVAIGRITSQAGISLAIHAIGDRANREVLNGLHELRSFERERNLPPLRHRIEHVQVIHPDDINRLGNLDVMASMQPLHAISDMEMAERSWGDRSKFAYAWKSLLEEGATLLFGSDAPVDIPNPFEGIHAAITRRRRDGSPSVEGWQPSQRISTKQAIQAYTTKPAHAAGMEDRLGILAPGFYADLIVLEFDPFHCDPAILLDASPTATMANGRWVWQEGQVSN